MTRIIIKPVVLQSHRDSFNLYAIGDIHKGEESFEEAVYKETLEIIKSDEEQKLIVWMGDYVTHFPKFDYRSDKRLISKKYSDVLSAYSSIRDDIKPFMKDTVAILEGNHDADWFKAEEQDFVSWICTELGVPFAPFIKDKTSPYATYEAYIRLKVKRVDKIRGGMRNINIVAWHGGGAPRTKGGAVNVLSRPTEVFPLLNVIMMGHLHRHGVIFDNLLDVDEKERKIVDLERYYVFTGAFQRGFPEDVSTYVSKKMLPPQGLGAVKLEIQPFWRQSDDKMKVKWQKVP